MSSPKFTTKKILFASLALLIVFGLSGCTRFFTLPPDQLLSTALANLYTSRSLVAQIEILKPNFATLQNSPAGESFVASPELTDQVAWVKFIVATDFRKPSQAATRIKFASKKNTDDKDINLGAEIFMTEQDLYFNLEKLPAIDSVNLEKITGQTYKLALRDLVGILPTNNLAYWIPQDVQSKALAKKIKEQKNLFENIEQLDAAELNGEQVRRLKATLNREALENLFKELSDDKENFNPEDIKIPEALIQQPLEIWVGQKSQSIVRIMAEGGDTAEKIDIIFSEHNRNLKLEPPSAAKDITLFELMGLLGSTIELPDIDTSQLEQSFGDLEELLNSLEDNTIQLDLGNSTLPGLDNVPFPVQ